MTLTRKNGLFILALALLAALGGGIAVWADSGSGAGTAVVPPATTAAAAAAEKAAPCGCGGPKAYYLKKYGTIKPPALQFQNQGQPQATAPGATPVNPTVTGSGG